MVANLSHRLLSFEECLAYGDDTDNRYELVGGVLVAMTPPLISHFDIAKLIERCFDEEIKRLGLPWRCYREAGLRVSVRKSRIMGYLGSTHSRSRRPDERRNRRPTAAANTSGTP
ncbi:MAG: Uma2 family endonuclease [Candidatus Competibacter sp.]|nr:Uma2 family endonuclease [Candidatus Competibacter sp.]